MRQKPRWLVESVHGQAIGSKQTADRCENRLVVVDKANNFSVRRFVRHIRLRVAAARADPTSKSQPKSSWFRPIVDLGPISGCAGETPADWDKRTRSGTEVRPSFCMTRPR